MFFPRARTFFFYHDFVLIVTKFVIENLQDQIITFFL